MNRSPLFHQAWLGAVCLLCLLPLALVASRLWNGAPLSHWYRLQLNCAAVFTHHNHVWSQPVTLVKRGNGRWEQVDQARLTPMPIAGYRLRWDRITWEADRRKVRALWPRAAQFVAERLHDPGAAPVTEVRIIKVLQRSTDKEAKHPQGRWAPPPYEHLKKGQFVELAHCVLKDDAWTSLAPPPAAARVATAPPAPTPIRPGIGLGGSGAVGGSPRKKRILPGAAPSALSPRPASPSNTPPPPPSVQ